MGDVDSIKLQLSQITLLLELDPDNGEYLELKNDLTELLELTESGLE